MRSAAPRALSSCSARSPRVARGGGSNAAATVAEATQHYITSLDVLKLGMHEVDQVQPPLSDLLNSLHRVPQLPPDFEGKVKVRDWLARLGGMRAVDRLAESEVRQLAFDLESSYNGFIRELGGGGGGGPAGDEGRS